MFACSTSSDRYSVLWTDVIIQLLSLFCVFIFFSLHFYSFSRICISYITATGRNTKRLTRAIISVFSPYQTQPMYKYFNGQTTTLSFTITFLSIENSRTYLSLDQSIGLLVDIEKLIVKFYLYLFSINSHQLQSNNRQTERMEKAVPIQ